MTYTRILSILAVGCLSMTLGESTAALATQQFAISEADERWLDDDESE